MSTHTILCKLSCTIPCFCLWPTTKFLNHFLTHTPSPPDLSEIGYKGLLWHIWRPMTHSIDICAKCATPRAPLSLTTAATTRENTSAATVTTSSGRTTTERTVQLMSRRPSPSAQGLERTICSLLLSHRRRRAQGLQLPIEQGKIKITLLR
jgi:hypothetical protein